MKVVSMRVVFDEIGFLMKVVFNETFFLMKMVLMKVVFTPHLYSFPKKKDIKHSGSLCEAFQGFRRIQAGSIISLCQHPLWPESKICQSPEITPSSN